MVGGIHEQVRRLSPVLWQSRVYNKLAFALETARNRSGFDESRTAGFLKDVLDLIPDIRHWAWFMWSSENLWADLLTKPPESTTALRRIEETGLVLRPHIWAYLQNEQRPIEEVIAEIAAGGFDRSSDLHMELEYARYMNDNWGDDWFDEFSTLFMLGEQNILTPHQVAIAKATAREASAVYNLLVERYRGQEVLVVGNMRYGSQFVVQPIEERLKAEGFRVEHRYVKSLKAEYNRRMEEKLDDLDGYIRDKKPHIVIVDGTRGRITLDGERSRFPTAMFPYIDGIRSSFEGYGLEFWSPDGLMGDTVNVGTYRREYPAKVDGERDLLIVNAASGTGSRCKFGDFEHEAAHEGKQGFTKTGYCERPLFTDEATFLAKAQAEIAKELDQLLEPQLVP